MESTRIAIDPILLTYVAQTLGRVPETLYDFQKIKNLACGERPVYQKLIDPLHDPVPERLKIVRGDFSVIGKMSPLKKLTISAMQVNDFSFLRFCTAADVKQWLFNLFALLDDTEGMERLCNYFGTYTCPECGERTSVFTGMEGYHLA